MSSGSEPANAGAHDSFRRAALAVFGLVAYQFLVHVSLGSPQGVRFAGLLAALPLFALGAWLVRRPALPARLAGAALAAGALMLALGRGFSPALCHYLVQMMVYLAVFWLFARTLVPGRQALVTRMARSVHGELPAPLERYTRHVTWYWCGVLVLLPAVSTALFLLAPLPVWSFFANVLNAPLLAGAFVAEYLWRLARYPQFSHASIAASLGAFRRIAGGTKSALPD
jgi:uncharacterized membrane protein